MSSKPLLETGHDRARRSDGKLLADHLEDERPECVKRRKFVEPRPRMEVRLRIDEPRENRVCLPQELARLRIGSSAHERPADQRRPPGRLHHLRGYASHVLERRLEHGLGIGDFNHREQRERELECELRAQLRIVCEIQCVAQR